MDETIIQTILNLQTTQAKAVLATIIRTEGSTPRGLGTQMLVMETGQIVGTIGGGTAERLVVPRALTLLRADSDNQAEIQRLMINQETSSAQLAVCGSCIEVLLEPVQEKTFWQIALDLQMSGKEAVIVTSLVPPFPKSILDVSGNVLWGQFNSELLHSAEKLQEIYSGPQAKVVEINEKYSWLVQPILQTKRLLILGAGHVAREVAYYAKPLDFQVTVIDDRAAFARPEFFPGVYEVICSDFRTGIKNYKPNCDTYVVIATWSHQNDAACLQDILNYAAKYVGMLGSKKKVTTIVNHLQQEGYTAQTLARLRAPIGLNINAQTPSEIAISILAEIIAVKHTPV
ncbi:Xanthine and CO dehydrogenases maturation factor, XdhC/CoxF family [Candidatus Desulfosporosinus infrequens]|uniref:Xanthine and CO dehydrogenases maturation factor, XdhC/CoxF family n=1 Tax=Candidatus Desulfosporosinus infrequens TaxID=2043169 RepID=A0A2U3KM19_9FIRM|nr:Xanthine and CO dehydrogenases maturation factor, XdhC/CoxF family [Candidatus Desulfosporosinus infrequens]